MASPSSHMFDYPAVRIVADMRMDVLCYLEQSDEPPPAYFRERRLLDEWAALSRLRVESGDGNALHIRAWKRAGGTKFAFSPLWVRAASTRYRDHLKNVYVNALRSSPDDLKGIHADHVINRANVAYDAWVQLFPVSACVNLAFGAKFEKFLPPVDPLLDRINLPPLMFFKLFCRKVPKNAQEWDQEICHVREQILPLGREARAYRKHVEEDVRRAINREFSTARRQG